MTPNETRAYEEGEQAAMRGLSMDECRYRKHDLKAHWLRGWHAWHRAQPVELSEEDKAQGRAALARIKGIIKGLP